MPKQIRTLAILIGLVLGLIAIYVTTVFKVLPQSSYFLLPELASPKSTDRILLVSPHPDDETLGAGGYLETAAAQGATIKIVLATDGNKHGLRDTRYQEIENSVKTLGIDPANITFMGYPDGELSKQADFSTKLKNIIDDYQPTTVITTLPEDLHPDHAACGRAVRDAQTSVSVRFTAYYFLIHYHRYPRPIGLKASSYLLPPPNLISSAYQWEKYPLTKSEQDTKYQAIDDYKTQLSNKNPVLKQLLQSFVRQNELFAVVK